MNLPRCHQCGAEYPSDALFCPDCGASLASNHDPLPAGQAESSSSRPENKLVPCPDCGHSCSRSALVCPSCGRPLQSDKHVELTAVRTRSVTKKAVLSAAGLLML